MQKTFPSSADGVPHASITQPGLAIIANRVRAKIRFWIFDSPIFDNQITMVIDKILD
jgi:hypothetical protein